MTIKKKTEESNLRCQKNLVHFLEQMHVHAMYIVLYINLLTTLFLQLLGDVPEEEDAEDAELQASIASASKWRKIAALTRQRAAEVHCII